MTPQQKSYLRIAGIAISLLSLVVVYFYYSRKYIKDLEEKGDPRLYSKDDFTELNEKKCLKSQSGNGFDEIFINSFSNDKQTTGIRILPKCQKVGAGDKKKQFSPSFDENGVRQCCETGKKDSCFKMIYDDKNKIWKASGDDSITMAEPQTLDDLISSDDGLKALIGKGGVTASQAVDICASKRNCGVLVIKNDSPYATIDTNGKIKQSKLTPRSYEMPDDSLIYRFDPKHIQFYKGSYDKDGKQTNSDYFVISANDTKGSNFDYFGLVPFNTIKRDIGDRPWSSRCQSLLKNKYLQTVWPLQGDGGNRHEIVVDVDGKTQIDKNKRISSDTAKKEFDENPLLKTYNKIDLALNENYLREKNCNESQGGCQ